MGIGDLLPAWLGGKKKAPVGDGVKKIMSWTLMRVESVDQSNQAAGFTKTSIESILRNKQSRGDVKNADEQLKDDAPITIPLLKSTTTPGLFKASGTFMVDSSKVNSIATDFKKIGGITITPI